MNEQLPPTPPPAPPPVPPPPPSPYPAPWKTTIIGVLIFIGSVLMCFVSPSFLLFGFVGALVPLFIKGYRCIFLGYILGLGLTLLGLTIACAIDPPNFH